MDAIAGACCTFIGLGASRLVYRRWPYSFPKAAPAPVPLPQPELEPVGAGQ
jgi:hypothetical protein